MIIIVVERGNDTLGSFPHQIFDLSTNFQRKFDNGYCNDVEKQSNFTKFDCLKADKSAFVETSCVSTFYNHYEQISEEICCKIKDFVSKQECFD